MIKVLIAEDQAMVLGALAALIDIEQDLEVVAQASSGSDALKAALTLKPDVVVTDIEMPGLSGLELATELLTIEATGDLARAQTLLERYGVSTPEMQSVIAQLKDIPVDITPVFPAAGEK